MAKKESSTKQKLTNAQKAYLSRIKNLVSTSSSFQSLLLEVRQHGKNWVRQTERLESKRFDERFVDELEKGFNAIDSIIANPRTFIKESPELVEAGLAKKINAQSITHLASHTQFVHSVDEKGNVTPEKILTIHAEIDVQIYENRFVMTLIKKCSLFIEKRFNYIKDHGETRDSDLLLLKSVSNIDGAQYEIDSRIKVSTLSKDDGNKEKNQDLLNRLATLRERCAYYMRSPFMADMAGAKDVANPIHMTNMIVKNPYYHAAYELWKFIDSYTDLGISYNVKETEQEFTQPYFEELLSLVLADILTLRSNRIKDKQIDSSKTKERIVNPKVLFTLEDETYYDGKFLYDQFPAYKKQRYNPMALTPEEAKEERLAIESNVREERYKKTLLDEAIEEQKDKDIAKEAIERQKKLEAEEKARIKKEKEEAAALEKQRKLEEKARKQAEKEALQKEQKELEKARKAVKRTAKQDKKDTPEVEENKPRVEEKKPLIILTRENENNEPKEEKPVEEIRQPVEEALPVEEETKENVEKTISDVAIDDTPIEEMPPKEEAIETPIEEKEETPVVETPVEEPTQEQVENAPTEEIDPSFTISPEEENQEATPSVEPIDEAFGVTPIEEKPKKKRAPRKKKEEVKEEKPKTTRKKKTKEENKAEPLPAKEENPLPVVIEEPIKEETPTIVESFDEASPNEEELQEDETAEEIANESLPNNNSSNGNKEKYKRDVPTFRAEKNYVFIKTRKSPKAKKVFLKGKLK